VRHVDSVWENTRPAATVVLKLSACRAAQPPRRADVARLLAAEGLPSPEGAAFALIVEAAASAFVTTHPAAGTKGGRVMTLGVDSAHGVF